MSFRDYFGYFSASDEIIDLYFIQTDLKEIVLTESELFQAAQFDALAADLPNQGRKVDHRPIGKRVY